MQQNFLVDLIFKLESSGCKCVLQTSSSYIFLNAFRELFLSDILNVMILDSRIRIQKVEANIG